MAYIYAPAVLVTPLGALSIIVRYKVLLVNVSQYCGFMVELTCSVCAASAVLAHFLLKERLQKMGVLGCVSCIVGSVLIVIHAPQEQTPSSVQEIWDLATQPGWFSSLFYFLVLI